MKAIQSVSVCMPTWQGMEFLERVLSALAAQEMQLPWDFQVIDSGSKDGTIELLEHFAADFPVPFKIEHIDQVEFDHGDTRNRLALRSSGDLLVFLTQDAIPSGSDWLAKLVANFVDERVAAAYCRNVPRPDAWRLTKFFSAGDLGYREEREVLELPADYDELGVHPRRDLYNFNDVASAVRREIWQEHPFPRAFFGEDILMARSVLEAGWKIVYDADASVEHSHDYSAQETYQRAKIDGRFNAEYLDRTCVACQEDVEIMVARFDESDRAGLAAAYPDLSAEELEREAQKATELRRAAFQGMYEGGQTDRRYPISKLREPKPFHVLYVLHGFPPDTWAGTEVFTLGIAEEMQRRGHKVTILCRAPAEGKLADVADFTIVEDSFRELRVLRMVHRLQHANVRESFDQPKAAAAFRDLVEVEQPDVVHFQHLIHLSAGLVHVARQFGLATVVHLHDYWAICPRVQMIRPDGSICPSGMGAGCHLCVHERGLSQVERLKRVGEEHPEQLQALAIGQAAHSDRETRGPRSAAHWEGLGDLLARQDYVRSAYQACDLRISPSRFLRKLLVDTAGFDAHTTIFSDNGLRTDHVQALEKDDRDGAVHFGFAGTLVDYKGSEVLVRAMNRLRGVRGADGKRAKLLVFGDFRPEDNEHHRFLQQLAEEGDSPNVVFRGRFDNAKLSEVYAEIDVLIVPSIWYENSPVTMHEAYLCETPVVASRLGGMQEYVRHGVDGLLFEPGDDEDLARTLRRFLDEDGLLESLSKDWMHVKDLVENGDEMELRYRQLLCVDRSAGPQLLAELTGQEGQGGEPQGADMILLRPEPFESRHLNFDLSAAGQGSSGIADRVIGEIEVDVMALAGEDVLLGGNVVWNGMLIGEIPITAGGESDELRNYRFSIPFESRNPGPHSLTLEAKAGEAPCFLRVKCVRAFSAVLEPRQAPEVSAQTSAPPSTPANP